MGSSRKATVQSRAGDDRIHLARLDTPLGPMIAGATDEGICLLEFTGRRRLQRQLAFLRRRFKATPAPARHRHLTMLRRELRQYFAGARLAFGVPVDMRGTDFEMRVWSTLRTIPCGETRSYAQVARLIGRPTAVRAVGRANGRNAVAIVIPCHRLVSQSGSLAGYGGGLWRKRRLLDLEATCRRA